MSEVVLQVVALGLERIVVFVLDFPAGTPGRDDAGNVVLGNREVGDERVVVDLFAF